jgi:hypothetical protein
LPGGGEGEAAEETKPLTTVNEKIDEAWAKCNGTLAELDTVWAKDRELRKGTVAASCQAKLRVVAEEEQAAAEAQDEAYQRLQGDERHCRNALSLLGWGKEGFRGWDLVGEDTGVEALPLLRDADATPLFLQGQPHASGKHAQDASLLIVRHGAQLYAEGEEGGEGFSKPKLPPPSILPDGARLVGTGIGLEQASGCAELDVLDMAQGGKCYVLLTADSNFPPTTVLSYTHDPLTHRQGPTPHTTHALAFRPSSTKGASHTMSMKFESRLPTCLPIDSRLVWMRLLQLVAWYLA